MKDLLVCLVDENGRSYVVENGAVRTTARITPITVNPGGMTDLSIGWERSLPELGITRNLSAQMQYIFEAATILKDYFHRQNLEKKVYLQLLQRTLRIDTAVTPNTFAWHYAFLYRGEIDPTSIKHADTVVTASVSEGGLLTKYKANKGTTYDIPLDGDLETILVKVDGVRLAEKQYLLIPAATIGSGSDSRHMIGISPTSAEGKAFGLYFGTAFADLADPSDYNTDDRYFMRSGLTITGIRIQGKLVVRSVFSNGPYEAILRFSTGRVISLGAGNITGSAHVFNVDVTFDMAPDERCFLIADYFSSSSLGAVEYGESELAVSFKSRYPATFVKCHRPDTMHRRITGNIAGNETLAVSSILGDTKWPVVTCGDAVRGIAGAVIKTSHQQFTEMCRTQMAADVGIEGGKLLIEPFEHYLDATNPVNLGPAKNLVITSAKDQLVNTVKVGYEPPEIDDVNGKYAFCNTLSFTSPLTRTTKELALVCPYAADPYFIEILRINFGGKTTTDDSSDNKVMLLDADLDNPQTDPDLGTYYNLRRPAGMTITGVPDPETIFNIGLSPRRMLNRQKRLLASLFYGFSGQRLRFTTTERNKDLVTQEGGVTVFETADYVINGRPLFIPKYFDFDTEVPMQLADAMEANPNRCFNFTWYDKTYSGFSLKVGISPTDNKGQAFHLLVAPTSNLNNLVIYG
jgi:hypothetical protein